MKFLILLISVFALIKCDEMHFYHYKEGTMKMKNDQPIKISGSIFVELLEPFNITIVSGLHIKNGVETPFYEVAQIAKYKRDNDKIDFEGTCLEVSWGTKTSACTGEMKLKGTWNESHYESHTINSETKAEWDIHLLAHYAQCPVYPPPEAAQRVKVLLNQPSEQFAPVNVLNYAIMGFAYIKDVADCSFYAQNFWNMTEPKPGFIIVGKDGKHCGIMDHEGDKFYHSNPAKKILYGKF